MNMYMFIVLKLWRLSHIPNKPRQALVYRRVTSRCLPATRSESCEPSVWSGEVEIVSYVWPRLRNSARVLSVLAQYAANRRSSNSTSAHVDHIVAPLLHILWMEIVCWSSRGKTYDNDHICWTSCWQPGVPCCPQSRSPKPIKYNPNSGSRLKKDAFIYWDYFYNMALAWPDIMTWPDGASPKSIWFVLLFGLLSITQKAQW